MKKLYSQKRDSGLALDLAGKWLPNRAQLLLLKAALLDKKEALAAWQEWRSLINFDEIDPASYNLIPRLYRNLTTHNLPQESLQQLKGIYRATWAQNQLRFFELKKLFADFSKAGISDPLLLKGAALTLFYYREFGLRPMGDIDILVRKENIRMAIDQLQKNGWQVRDMKKIPNDFIHTRHALGFINEKSELKHIDLHWHLMPEISDEGFNQTLFADKIKMDFQNHCFYAPSPTAMLLHTVIHGCKTSIVPLIRWIMDADCILKVAANEIDWQLLMTNASSCHSTLTLASALSYLKSEFHAFIPESVLEKFRQSSISPQERREFYWKTSRYTNYYFASAASIWYTHSKNSGCKSLCFRLLSFPSYLRKYWGLNSLFSLPNFLFYKIRLSLKKIKEANLHAN